jgi:hypothetical protein
LIQRNAQIVQFGKLSSKFRDGESAMINRENELPSYPFVEAALKAIADWVTSYRNAVGFNNDAGPARHSIDRSLQ